MGKTRDLFKKIRDTKGTFHAKMGSINPLEQMATHPSILAEEMTWAEEPGGLQPMGLKKGGL